MRSPTDNGLTVSVKKLVSLERAGRYEEALELFGEDWKKEQAFPGVSDPELEPDRLLRFGALIGFYGYKHGIRGAQERSKDLVTRAREAFLLSGDIEKVTECENFIALAYWRNGETREALAWAETALGNDCPAHSDARLYAEVTRSMLLLAAGRIEENISNCLSIESVMRSHGDPFLNGSLATNLALSLKRASRLAEAQQYLELALYYHKRSRHKTYLGTVHNNLAQLLKEKGKFVSAHESADAAIKIYRQIKDRTREASTWDTKAQIYLSELKFPDALAAADKSIKMLKNSPASAVLAESFLTRAKALLGLDRFTDAFLSLVEGVNLAREQDGEYAAKALVDDLVSSLKEIRSSVSPAAPISADELEIVLPESLAGHKGHKGIWISTDKLEAADLPRGSFAIVVPEKVKRGDLVAILELKENAVSCGYYDSEFGIICLEGCNGEPELFDETAVEILGKIVGVCRDRRDPEGRMVVEALSR